MLVGVVRIAQNLVPLRKSRKLNEGRGEHSVKVILRLAFRDKEEVSQIRRVGQKFVNDGCTVLQVRKKYETITNTRYLIMVLPLPAVIAAAEYLVDINEVQRTTYIGHEAREQGFRQTLSTS